MDFDYIIFNSNWSTYILGKKRALALFFLCIQ
ncbi:hypothetical protein PQE99_gp33 [Streptococcus phage P4761]|uniref:Uncharacterized protein n=1 Tax=Streptococcus phage P4761 TaxID=1971417 RepID=A0A286QPK9_9CAUD|nr:hypothetical protein PQE99_gp33 [Streptococcus phage P4761]ARU13326.1 hypothetical protein P4761_33 [Streptococcus phage P4761]